MSGKHTSGPWNIRSLPSQTDGEAHVIVAGSGLGGFPVVAWTANTRCDDGENRITPEDRANGCLIAAAPELLEALKLAEHLIELLHEEQDCELLDPKICCDCETLAGIRAAISKAEGPQVNRCPHSACSQNHIDTGETECIEGGE
jgi:hypothetical protein